MKNQEILDFLVNLSIPLEDNSPHPVAVWNRLPDQHRDAIVELALDEPILSPRELAVRYTDENRYFVSESTVYRLLKAQDLITSPAYILMQASDRFQHPSHRVNDLWQTDFTYCAPSLRRCH